MSVSRQEVTDLPPRQESGALDQLIPLVHEEPLRLAHRQMAGERELGFDNKYLAALHSQLVQRVAPGRPAERMKPGDHIIAINGAPIDEDSLTAIYASGAFGGVREADS